MDRKAIIDDIEFHKRGEKQHREAREALEKKLEEPREWEAKEVVDWNGFASVNIMTRTRVAWYNGADPLSKAIAEFLTWMLNDMQRQPEAWGTGWCNEIGVLKAALQDFNRKEGE